MIFLIPHWKKVNLALEDAIIPTMKRKYLLALPILVIIILITTGGYFLLKYNTNTAPKTAIKTTKSLPKEVTITLDKSGFKPNTVTVERGTAVRWINKSGDKQTVNSDNYPTNQLHKELNLGIFNDGSSVVYTFNSPGIYGYHNQLNPKQTGKVIVK